MSLEEYLAEHPKKHLIFDLDRTILRLDINWNNVHHLLFEQISKIDSSIILKPSLNAREFFTAINQAVEKHGNAAKQTLISFMRKFEKINYSGYTPNPEIIQFIRSHHNNYQLFIWTSNVKDTIQKCLITEHLSPLFQEIVTINDVLYSKPYPDGFYKIYSPSHPKTEYLMIGDSENDEEAAKAAGIDFFKVDYFDRH